MPRGALPGPPPPPAALRLVNWVAPRGWPRLDADLLVARARRRAGLQDLGEPPWREPLHLLVADLERGGLTSAGRALVRAFLAELLVTRLEIQRALWRRPAALAAPVERPLFIVGLPRTGTTLLHRLVACDPDLRWLSEAESLYLPSRGAAHAARVRLYRGVQRLSGLIAPGLDPLHERSDPRAPEEELPLLQRSFVCPAFAMYCDLPAYQDWLYQLDHGAWIEVYGYVRRQLQLAQLARPGGPWALKCPAHALGAAALMEVFPDARLVQIDRDPAEIAGSYLGLETRLRSLFVDPSRQDRIAQGRCMADFVALFSRRLDAARRAAAGRCLVLRYQDLVADPMSAVRRIYELWGRPLASGAAERMRAHLEAVARRPRPPHRYALADWGLRPEDLRHSGQGSVTSG